MLRLFSINGVSMGYQASPFTFFNAWNVDFVAEKKGGYC
ncbi:hypothetical protein QE357_002123 [Siphonobacter sp. BAB-5404]|nr:hypothetical protein [Siphonobacter sp. SORGH_AS_1065]MDR6195071.1 hypothetical protein [Siphonobacter sp. SORGH_AS_0500]